MRKRNIIEDAGLPVGNIDPHIEPPTGFFLPHEGRNRKARRAARAQVRRITRKRFHRMQARSRYALALKARQERSSKREAEKNG